MFIKFRKDDTIYKIFSTIQKIPNGKKIKIFIDCKNEFFSNIWWWKQLKDLLEEKNLKYIFYSNGRKCDDYFLNLKIPFVKRKNIKDILKNILKFFFPYYAFRNPILIKTLPIWTIFIVIIEFLLVWYILYWFYNFISHHAIIYITPSYKVETIVNNFFIYTWFKPKYKNKYYLPFYTKTINVEIDQTISVSNLKYITHPSQWQVIIYNFTNKDLSFKAWTKFITDNGLLFRAKYWFRLPPSSKDWKPGIAYVSLVALDRDINWDIIWKRGNIISWTKLYILKYPPSRDLHKIYAVAIWNFQWWETIGKWIVTKQDIQRLKDSLIKTFKSKIPDWISKDIWQDSEKVLINFPQFISWKVIDVSFDAKPWQIRSIVNWKLKWKITYSYLLWPDIKKGFEIYLQERSLESEKLIDIDRKSLILLDVYPITKKLFMIPIRVDIVKWYNFKLDKSGLLDKIKLDIAGKSIKEAKNIILSYPQIDSVVIKVYPVWYNILPKLKSEIKFKVLK